jgi:hypothetical protein
MKIPKEPEVTWVKRVGKSGQLPFMRWLDGVEAPLAKLEAKLKIKQSGQDNRARRFDASGREI